MVYQQETRNYNATWWIPSWISSVSHFRVSRQPNISNRELESHVSFGKIYFVICVFSLAKIIRQVDVTAYHRLIANQVIATYAFFVINLRIGLERGWICKPMVLAIKRINAWFVSFVFVLLLLMYRCAFVFVYC